MTDQSDLFGLALEQFVPARGRLAKALRKDGRREDAQNVSSLRKPSLAAWAVNQLVRTRRREIAALLTAGDAVQRAQSELLAGRGDGQSLSEALTHEREAVSALVASARGLLSTNGHALSQSTLDRVSETLHAAALDDAARDLVEDGCLTRELRHSGLGHIDVNEPDPVDRSPASSQDGDRARQRKAARQAEAQARRSAERAERKLHAAQERRDKAAESLHEAEEMLATARDDAQRAASERDRAHDAAQ